MSNLPKPKVKEFFKNLCALLFITLLVMVAGYFAGKKLEEVGNNNRTSEGWSSEDQAEWLETMKKLEQTLEMLENKENQDKTGKLEVKIEENKVETIPQIIKRVSEEEGVDYRTILAVLKCESSLNPNAIHINRDGTKDRGIAQLNNRHYSWVEDWQAFNPEIATRIVCQQFKAGKANDWTCYKNNYYKKYLN